MEIEKQDIDALKREIERLNINLSSMGDDISNGIREGLKTVNSPNTTQRKPDNDTEKAEKANEKLFLRQKDQYDKTQELNRTKVKTPEQKAQEEFNKQQTTTNDYLRQLANLTRENQYNELKSKSGQKNDSILDKMGTMVRGMAQGGTTKNPFENLMTGSAQLGVGLKDTFGGIKGIFEKRRQKKIDTTKTDINKDKTVLSAEQAELEKLKKQPKTSRDNAAIDELEASIAKRKKALEAKAQDLGSKVANEYLIQKQKQDKNFKFEGRDKELVAKQMRDNIASSITDEFKPKKKPIDKQSTDISKATVGGIGDSTAFIKLNNSIDKLSASINTNNTELNKLVDSIREFTSNKPKEIQTELDKGLDNSVDGKSDVLNKPVFTSDSPLNGGSDKVDKPPTILKNIFDTPLKDASNPRTAGEYIAGIYNKLNKPVEDKVKAVEGASESGGFMSMLGKLLPALVGLGPMLATMGSAIAAVAGPLVVAAGGAYLMKKTYDMTEQSTEGTTVGDIGAGISGFISGKGFSESLEERQTKRVGAIHQKETDAKDIDQYKNIFNSGEKPILQPFKKYISDADINGLEASYIDYRSGNSSYMQYKIERNKLLKQAKEQQLGEGSVDAEFNQLTGKTPTPQTKSTTPPKGGEGSRGSVETKTSMAGMAQSSGMDQMTAMTIQAKLIAMEMMTMQKSPDYVNSQKSVMKENGIATADKLMGG